MVSEGTKRMIRMRDAVDEKFLAYATPETMGGNYEALSQLALIGGRLDVLIRRNLAAARRRPPPHHD